jgi:hypothetical protein
LIYVLLLSGDLIGIGTKGSGPPFCLFHKSYRALVDEIIMHLNEVDPEGELLSGTKPPTGTLP